MYQDSTAGKMKNFLFANVSWAQAFSLLRLCQRNVIFCRLFFLGFTMLAVKKVIKVKKKIIIACKKVVLYIIWIPLKGFDCGKNVDFRLIG